MLQRTITGLVLALVLIPVIMIPVLYPLFLIIISAFAVIACIELVKMYETEKKMNLPTKIVVITSAMLVFLGSFLGLGNINLGAFELSNFAFPLILIAVLMNLSLLVFVEDYDARDVSKALFISGYVGFGVASFACLRALGVEFVIYLLMITAITDIFAYFFGVLFGRHKMSPKISPKKSWEGAIGGSCMGTALASCFAIFYGGFAGDFGVTILGNGNALIIVLLIVVSLIGTMLGQIGDLVASKLKRTYDIKDFGKIFPGHGGVLDRFDSAIFVSMFLLAAFMMVNVFVNIF